MTDAAKPPPGPDAWDVTAEWLAKRGALPALGLITLGLAIIYAGVFRGELAGDDLSFHMAESARLADCLRVGDFDFWNPSGNAGFASAYYYQVLPQLVSALPAAVFGHHVLWFDLSVFLPLVLAPAAAYRGMRVMGATPWQSVLAALAVGYLNGESRWGTGNAGTFNVGLYTQTWALAAFPLALGHAVSWATHGKGLAPAIFWGAFMTLCHPFAGVCLGAALIAGWVAQLVLIGLDVGFAALGRSMRGDLEGGVIDVAIAHLGERWRHPPERPWRGELLRLAILGVCLAVTWMPIWLPLKIDYAGFGGFPHRVSDEIGPGFLSLWRWYAHGAVLDFARPMVLTYALPFVMLFARARYMRWLWAPMFLYAVWLGMGPHLGKTDDDLIPAVRFLGAMQVAMGLAIGAGALMIGRKLWHAAEASPLAKVGRVALVVLGIAAAGFLIVQVWAGFDDSVPLRLARTATFHAVPTLYLKIAITALTAIVLVLAVPPGWRALRTQYGLRTGIAAAAAALGVLLVLPGGQALAARVRVLRDNTGSHPAELYEVAEKLQHEPPGRKQVGPGAESHWWNLLTYEYGRRPSLLMMGGGGLQASPNYDFLWTVRDFAKNAWTYDAPILVFQKSSAGQMPVGDLVFETTTYMVRRLPSPGLVSPVEVTGTLPAGRKEAHTAAIDWYKTDLPLKDHVLAYDGSGGPGGPPAAKVIRAGRQNSPGDDADIYAEVDVTAKSTFVARESWHPRWHVYIDGDEAAVRRVTPDFPAVDVPPGHHVIAFRFERPWWAQACWLVWPLVPLLAWAATRRMRKPPLNAS